MSLVPEDKRPGRVTPALAGVPRDTNRPGTIRAVLRMRQGAGTPFEGSIEIGTSGPRAFHGWLELMGLVEAARAGGAP
jgi:hypothetical protein